MNPRDLEITRLYRLSKQATRLNHFKWAARLEERAITLKRLARHEMWLAELSPWKRAALGWPFVGRAKVETIAQEIAA